MIGKAREINNYKSLWCAEKVENKKLEYKLKNALMPKIAIMGLASK